MIAELKPHGWPVLRSGIKGAVYVRIPRDLQRPAGHCGCAYCRAHPDQPAMWDTLAVPITPGETTWTVHAPDWTTR